MINIGDIERVIQQHPEVLNGLKHRVKKDFEEWYPDNMHVIEAFEKEVRWLFDEAYELYKKMLDAGVAKECARRVLPISSPTRIYMTGNIRNWIHYIELRSANGTQKEHMDIALECKKIFMQLFPVISTALEWKS